MKRNFLQRECHAPENDEGAMAEAILAELKQMGLADADENAQQIMDVPPDVRNKVEYYFNLTRSLGPESPQATSFVERHANCHPDFVRLASKINETFRR